MSVADTARDRLSEYARRGRRLIVLSGPSGVGKSSIGERLEKEYRCARAITATTRAARGGERNGVHYHFCSREQFVADVAAGQFLEHADVYGNLYGTPVHSVVAVLERGDDALLIIDVQGARQLMDRAIEAAYVFVEPPNFSELERRLRGRASEDPAALARRLETAHAELAQKSRYQHCVVNENLAEAVALLARMLPLSKREQQ
ncbi:MAG: guanylate kinase [Planctomycetota bacterium]